MKLCVILSVALVSVHVSFADAGTFTKQVFKNASSLQSRIAGGYNAQRYQFPYQISLQSNGRHNCGGSILTQTWVVTAGHCVIGFYNLRVVAGMLYQGENHPDVQISPVARVVVHPYYQGEVKPNDIALLQLSSSLKWSAAVKPIQLPKDNEEFTGLAWVSGWGYLTSANPVTPVTLQQVQLEIWSFNYCANNLVSILGNYYPLDDTMICVGGAFTGSETVCQGDSGGPLVQNGKLLGVTSWTITPCGQYGSPSVYTKVSRFTGFIRQHVRGV